MLETFGWEDRPPRGLELFPLGDCHSACCTVAPLASMRHLFLCGTIFALCCPLVSVAPLHSFDGSRAGTSALYARWGALLSGKGRTLCASVPAGRGGAGGNKMRVTLGERQTRAFEACSCPVGIQVGVSPYSLHLRSACRCPY